MITHSKLAACEAVKLLFGVDDVSVVLIRSGTNDVFKASNGVIVRVRPVGSIDIDRYASSVAFANSVADSIPVSKPCVDEVMVVGDYLVTVWEQADGDKPATVSATGYREVGECARLLHDLPVELYKVYPVRAPVSRAWKRLEVLESLNVSSGVLAGLKGLLEDVEVYKEHIFPVTGALSICHNDLDESNVVFDKGIPRLIDFDSLGVGAKGFDFVPTVINSEVRCNPSILSDFESGYGSSVYGWSYLEQACTLRKLTTTLWVGTVQPNSEPRRAEFEKRVESLLSGTVSEPWVDL